MLKILYLLTALIVYSNQTQGLDTLPENQSENLKDSNKEITSFTKFLPNSLSSLTIQQTSKQELIQALGKPLKVDGRQNHFYNLSGRNYDTTIGIADNKISYILYSPPAGALQLTQLKPYIPQQAIDRAYQQKRKTNPSHSSGRTFEVRLPDQSVRITVRNNTQESVQSILFVK